MENHYVYMLSNKRNGTIYTGKADDLIKRVSEHKTKHYPNSFSAKYNTARLVYYEHYPDHNAAAARERQLKNWRRQWKINLIEENNPLWRDLYDDITQ